MCTEHHHWHHDYVRLAWDSGFSFEQHKSKTNLDWSSISILDIEQIIRDRDVAIVEKHLNTVTTYCLESDHTKILDPTFVKVFKLGQFSIQYLQFCKHYLDNTVVLLKKELAKYGEENGELKDYTEALKTEIAELKIKVKALKDSLESQTLLLESGNSFKCPTCLKMFLTEDYLIAHIKRRHESTTLFQSETDKLQLEIKELKERLNTTEKFIQSDNRAKIETIPDNNKAIVEEKLARVDVLIYKFDELKQFVERELSTLRNEKCNDKYERWLEIVFRQLDNSKKELQSKKYDNVDILSSGDGYCENGKTDSVTQTGHITYKDSEMMTEVIGDAEAPASPAKPPALEVDIKKLQEDLYANTENQLGQIQDALEQKLTGGLEQIQTQINTFYEKFNSLEAERTSTKEHKEFTPPTEKRVPTITLNTTEVTVKSKIDEESQPRPAPRITKSLPLVKEKKAVGLRRSAPKLESKPFVKTPLCRFVSGASDYSSVSEDEKVFFAPKTSKPKVNTIMTVSNKDQPKSIEVKTLYNKNLKDVVDSSDSEQDDPIETPVKPSTSTLGRRSISSLKRAGQDKRVLSGLRSELEEMVNFRLNEIGVSPTWQRLPQKSYLTAMSIIRHQSELTKKKYPNYYKIKQKLLKTVDTTVKKTTKGNDKWKAPPIEKKAKPRVLVSRSKPPSEKISVYVTDEESSSNKAYVAPKEVREDGTIEVVETKPPSSLPSFKKKVLFDLEESPGISKNKPHQEGKKEPRQSSKQDRVPTLTMVMSKARTEDALIDKIDMFGSLVRPLKDESDEDTESITSSILDHTKAQISPTVENDDLSSKEENSNWEISDIS